MVPSYSIHLKICHSPSVQIPFQDDTVCDLDPNIKETVSPEFGVVHSSCFYVSQTPSCQWLLLWTVPGALPTVPFWLAIMLKKGEGKLRRSGEHGSNLFFHWVKFCQGRQRLLWFTGVRSTTWLWFSHAAQMLGSGSALLHMVPLTLRGRKINGLFFYCGLTHYALIKPAFED